MPTRTQIIKGMAGHLVLFFVNFCVLLGVVLSFNLLGNLPLLNLLVLSYMIVHAFTLLTIQLGIQCLEIIRLRKPTLLIGYYFQFSDEEIIPVKLLDPTKSRLAVITLILVVTGGPVIYPVFAVYGFIQALAYLSTYVTEPLRIIDPAFLIESVDRLLGQLMAPVVLIITGLVILSVVVVEFRHI